MKGATEAVQRLVQAGKPAEAENFLRAQIAGEPANSTLRLLLAQLLAGIGRKPDALEELLAAVALSPRSRDARLLLARLANELKRASLAAQHARLLIEQDSRDSEAWSALGMAAFGERRKREATQALRRAVALVPSYAAAHYNLAAVLCDQEYSEEALEEAALAARHGARPRGVALVKARALIQLDRLPEAEQLLLELLRENRHDVDAQGVLLQLRQLQGDAEPLRELRAAALASAAPPAMKLALADAERRGGSAQRAEEILRALIEQLGPDPRLHSSLATVLQESGRTQEALEAARIAYRVLPEDAGIAENFVVAALCAGAHSDALPVVEHFLARLPRDQRWITYRVDLARLRGESRFDSWFDTSTLVAAMDLPPPPGYSNITDFHVALAPAIESLHRHQNHPLDQSLRHGTQTSRNLLVRPGTEIAALLELFGAALAQFQSRLGQDASHPFRARNGSAAEILGCWSVRLRRGGHHVNHIHPEGWISSAYYLGVPPEVSDPGSRHGWLKFGEPRFAVAGLQPLAYVQPAPGRLVLFPSYFWHGTQPLAQDVPRVSVAFDALPRAEIF